MSRKMSPVVVLIVLAISTLCQAQNIRGGIEGSVVDEHGSPVPGVMVTTRNIGTGEVTTTTTNNEGKYQFPKVTPGSIVVAVYVKGVKRFEMRDIDLRAGETMIIPIALGASDETVVVKFDPKIIDTSRIVVGRQLSEDDIKNLPLVSRQLHNRILLQPVVNGREVTTPLAIDMSVAGLQRRVAYQIDGSNSNDFHRSGFRLNPLSETSVQEVQLMSTNYPAEFGGTAGGIVNVITRSGTNGLKGTVGVLYRPSGLSAKPFAFQPGTDPNTSANGFIATVGGAIIKERWRYFVSYEWTRRHFIMPITIKLEDRNALISSGLSPSIFVNSRSTSDTYPYLNVRTDANVARSTHLSFRYNSFFTDLEHAGPGGLQTTDRSFGFSGPNYALSAGAQTTFLQNWLSEFRFQVGKSVTRILGDERIGRGPTVMITRVAGFGPDPSIGSTQPNERTAQFQESLTRILGKHTFKFGGGVNFITDRTTGQLFSQYTFDTLSAYIQAVSPGGNRKSYTKYQESSGNNKVPDNAIYYNTFFQDDWAVSERANLVVGVRYEYFDPPSGDPSAPLTVSRTFNSDGNNFAPRVGVTYVLRAGKYQTVVYLGAGMYYDPPLMVMYRRALLNNGTARYVSYTVQGGGFGPDFPNKVGPNAPPPDLDIVATNFKTMHAIRSSIQVVQALSDDMSVTLGYVNSIARHIPVYRSVNCRPTGRILADGRPVYGTTRVPCVNKVYPQFNIVKIVESGGNQHYNGAFIQFIKRFSGSFNVTANYTLSNSIDDAPEENGAAALTLSDPSSRRTDRGSSRGDLTHVFNMSFILSPTLRIQNPFLNKVFNHNQFSSIVIADSGETFNITTGDLNGDGITGADRPVGVARNSGRLPAYVGVDARYSRYFSLSGKSSLEFYIEATNLFNKKQVNVYQGANLQLGDVDPTTGKLLRPLPDRSTMSPTWRESRQVQLGFRLNF